MSAKNISFGAKFAPIAIDFNFPRAGASKPARELAAKMPRGNAPYWGIPFRLARKGKTANVLRLARGVEAVIPVGGRTAKHLCFLHYYEGKYKPEDGAAGGETLAEYKIVYADGRSAAVPVRLRYHVGCCDWGWGMVAYEAVRLTMIQALDFMNAYPLKKGHWGWTQTDVEADYGPAWIYAHENPRPDSPIDRIELKGLVKDAVGVIGLTLFTGPGHPLRHNPRAYFKLRVQPKTEVQSMDVDLGVLVRDAGPAAPRDEKWLKDPRAGLGVSAAKQKVKKSVRLIEASAAASATLTVKTKSGRRDETHRLSLGEAYERGSTSDGRARLEISHGEQAWVRVALRDADTGEPLAARVNICGAGGEYYAPYGHHTVINDNWFEDYGADVKLGATNFAYVRGDFVAKLPPGELFIEANRGFEYEPMRERVTLKPGQREIELKMRRWADRSKDGWVTADTHVHFISPQTAWLQGQCEGLNLINLLATQLGRLFTNVGDITGEAGVQKDNTIVWVGTENRHHILGHLSLLGTRGDPVYPMCCGGPSESYIGDPDERTLAEWADECREKDGLVIRPHFPGPNLENAVDIVLGKYDAVELRWFDQNVIGPLDFFNAREYYRYLNCGCRVACVGGTDKMSAGMPVGGVRTYAKLDPNRPFDFANWAAAVRAGRTYATSGPLIDLTVDGRDMGEEIKLTGGRGTVEVRASAESAWPMNRLEVVMNGRTAAVAESKEGARKLEIRARLAVEGTSWIAAACGSNMMVQHCWPIHLAAHTSPVYVVVPGSDLFSPSDATYMMTLIDGGLTYLDTLSVRFNEQRHTEMKAIFRQARERLTAKMPK